MGFPFDDGFARRTSVGNLGRAEKTAVIDGNNLAPIRRFIFLPELCFSFGDDNEKTKYISYAHRQKR